MKLSDIILEASYPNNIGAIEVFDFYKLASDQEKDKFNDLIHNKQYNDAWNLIQQVTGTKLQSNHP